MSDWQDIATAPKDGTWVLLKGGTMDYSWDRDTQPPAVVAQWVEHHERADTPGRWQFAWYDSGYYGEYVSPSHWMPAP